ncbi:MAG: RNA polymerase sigma factor, partial [Gemmataceae bacterium]
MQLDHLIRNIRRFADSDQGEPCSDRQLLEKFLATRDELAFEELLQRHGPMVLRLCRRLLPDKHRADDVFQATFLTLVAKGDSIDKRDAVGSWLYGVAYRVATRARARAALQREREIHVEEITGIELEDAGHTELRPVLDEEVQRLPQKYRVPVVLCYLEGKTNEQAAQELDCPAGTVKTRLSRARDLLRSRLARRGVTLTSAALCTSLEQAFAMSPPPAPALLQSSLLAASGKKPGAPEVSRLVEGAVRDLQTTGYRRFALAATLALGLVGGGFGLLFHHLSPNAGREPAEPVIVAAPVPEAERDELPTELGVVPLDASLFATFRISGLLEQEIIKKLRARMPDESAQLVKYVEEKMSIPVGDYDTFTHVVDRPAVAWEMFALKPRKKCDPDKVVAAKLGYLPAKKSIDGKLYYADEAELHESMYFLSDRLIANGRRDILDALIKRPVRARAEGNLRAALLLAAREENLFVVGADLRHFRDLDDFGELVREYPMIRPLLPCFDAESLTCSARIDAGELVVEARLVFDKKGKQGAEATRASLLLARNLLPLLKEQAKGQPNVAKLLDQVDVALKEATVKQDELGVRAIVRMKLDNEVAAAALGEFYTGARQAARRVERANALKQIA